MDQPRKIKILQCIRQGQIGGGESHLLSLVENLDLNHYDPVVLSFTDGPMIDRLTEMEIKNYVIPTTKPFDYRVRNKIIQLIKSEKIDVIHCHGTRAISNLFSAAKKLKIPLIYTIHGWSFHDDQNPVIKKIRILSEQFLTRQADKNIAVSQSNMLTGKSLIPGFDATVINNGINQTKFNPLEKYKNIRQGLGIASDDILIIFIARFSKQKQPIALIKAFAKAIKTNPRIKLLMVGDGEEKATSLQIAKQEVPDGSIHFLPFRQDVPDLLAAADIFVLPSLWEGLPIGLLEAMSMGKAVIATNVDGTKEIIRNKHNGILINPGELETALPLALGQLAEDGTLRQKISNNAITTITEHFSAAVMTKKIEHIYDAAMGIDRSASVNLIHHGV